MGPLRSLTFLSSEALLFFLSLLSIKSALQTPYFWVCKSRHAEEAQPRGSWVVFALCADVGIYHCFIALRIERETVSARLWHKGRSPQNCIDRYQYQQGYWLQFFAMTEFINLRRRHHTLQVIRYTFLYISTSYNFCLIFLIPHRKLRLIRYFTPPPNDNLAGWSDLYMGWSERLYTKKRHLGIPKCPW